MGLRGRVGVVTGSSQGIGRAIGFGLASEGIRLTTCARNEVKLRETSDQIESSTGAEVLSIRADLKIKVDVKSMVKETIGKFGRIDVLVNNTRGPSSMFFHETSEKYWREVIDSLLMSSINCCMEIIPYMMDQRWG